MSASANVGRNDPCPCGSGKKHKNCCNVKVDRVQEAAPRSVLPMVGLVAAVVVLAGTGIYLLKQRASTTTKVADVSTTSAAPQNNAPPFAVTSGDGAPVNLAPLIVAPNAAAQSNAAPQSNATAQSNAANTNTPLAPTGTPIPAPAINPNPTPVAFTPQPAGPVPPGKVWSPEHGHWHDAPGANPAGAPIIGPVDATQLPQNSVAFTPQPPGPAPAGKVWSTEHGHWHDVIPPK